MMITRLSAAAIGLLSLTSAAVSAHAKGKEPKKVLFFTKSSRFEHGVIKERDGQPSFAGTVMKELAAKNGFNVTVSKDGGLLSAEGLKAYDVFVFYTSGDLTKPGSDKNPPMPDKEAFLAAVKSGKGFVGIHSASDTFNSGSDYWKEESVYDPYIQMLGGEFLFHGEQQPATITCHDPKFPGFEECEGALPMVEEVYSMKHLANDLHVVLSLATWSVKNTGANSLYRRPPYPLAWARLHGKGRVFYTALGHREDVWTNPVFQKMLVGAIRWSAGEVRADVKPNIVRMTPGYAVFPPQDPKPEAKDAPRPAAPPAPPAPAPAAAAAPATPPK